MSLRINTWNNNRRGLARLPLQEHRPAFNLGGPVRLPPRLFGRASYDGRGRTFFFFAYERARLLDSTLIDARKFQHIVKIPRQLVKTPSA